MTKPFLSAWGRRGKLALLAASLWPGLYIVLFMAVWVTMAVGMTGFAALSAPSSPVPPVSGPAQGPPGALFAVMGVLFALHCLTMLVSMGLLVVYVVDVFRSPRLNDSTRVLWAVVLFMGNMVAFPVYWYVNVWRAPAPAGGAPGAPGVPPAQT